MQRLVLLGLALGLSACASTNRVYVAPQLRDAGEPADTAVAALDSAIGARVAYRALLVGDAGAPEEEDPLLATLALIYAASVLGPPPPSVSAIAWAGHLQWLFVAWGYWLDRHREASAGSTPPAR